MSNQMSIARIVQLTTIRYCLTKHVLLTSCSRVLLDKLTGSQPVKKFPEFYETPSFITAFTSVRYLSLSWASSIQSMLPNTLPEGPS